MQRRSRLTRIGLALTLVCGAALLEQSAVAQFGDLSSPRTAPTTAPSKAPATTAPLAAGSKTAENAEFGFRVSYPPTWEVRPIVQKRADLILGPVGDKPGKGFEVRPYWHVVVSTGRRVQPGASLDKTVAQIKEFAASAYAGAPVDVEDIQLGGDTPAKRVRFTGTRNNQRLAHDLTIALKDGKQYTVSGVLPADELETHRPVFDQLIGSFQWIDSAAAAAAAAGAATRPVGPGTFDSPEHGFRVAYSGKWMVDHADAKAGVLRLRPADVRPDERDVIRPNWFVNAAPIAPVPEAERTLDGLVTRRQANLKQAYPDAQFTEASDVTLAGVPGKRFGYSGTFDRLQMRGETTLTVKGETVFFLVGYASALEYEVMKPEFDALRTSFTWTAK